MMQTFFTLSMMLLTFSLSAQDKQASNKHFWYSLETTATPEDIWAIWVDVEDWDKWDSGLKKAEMEGDFQLGQVGTITSLEGRKSRFKIVEYEVGTSYTFKTNLPLGSLYVKRYLTTQNGRTLFTHEVWFRGLTRGIFAKAFGSKFREMLPEVLQNIKEIVES